MRWDNTLHVLKKYVLKKEAFWQYDQVETFFNQRQAVLQKKYFRKQLFGMSYFIYLVWLRNKG